MQEVHVRWRVDAASGHPRGVRPQIPVGRLPLQQSTALLPRHRHQKHPVHRTEEAAGHRAHVRRRPGVDPELFELTTAKLDSGSSGSRMADAFARLMSTVEKTSTSTRKPRKDENLSEEAAKVIAALPDLSFMQAKVLMFPATLTPLGSHATPD
uniref:Aftiphilin clathrin-binding box domain-containing protein n=1 Tax=Astatotilapia calliptera TaxID=8154 RepID=A0AAX7W755_ASTCA